MLAAAMSTARTASTGRSVRTLYVTIIGVDRLDDDGAGAAELFHVRADHCPEDAAAHVDTSSAVEQVVDLVEPQSDEVCLSVYAARTGARVGAAVLPLDHVHVCNRECALVVHAATKRRVSATPPRDAAARTRPSPPKRQDSHLDDDAVAMLRIRAGWERMTEVREQGCVAGKDRPCAAALTPCSSPAPSSSASPRPTGSTCSPTPVRVLARRASA